MAVDVVALRAAGVGDLLTSVPALRALAAQAGPVTLAAPAWLHPLAPLIPGVAGVVDVNGLQPKRPLTDAVAINLHGSGGGHCGTDQVCATSRTLAAFEIAVAGAGATLAGFQPVCIHGQAHAAAGLAPFKASGFEDFMQTFALGLLFYQS